MPSRHECRDPQLNHPPESKHAFFNSRPQSSLLLLPILTGRPIAVNFPLKIPKIEKFSGQLEWGGVMGFRHIFGRAFFALFLSGAATGAFAHAGMHSSQSGKLQVMKLQLTDWNRQLQELVGRGFDIAGVDYDKKQVDVIVGPDGFRYLPAGLSSSIESWREIDTMAAPDVGYATPAEVTAFVQKAALDWPEIVTVESIGKTLENRDIWAVRITGPESEAPASGKPVVFFNSMHHAREVMTTEVAFDTIEWLASNYGRDDRVTDWINRNEIWVIPMLNPDGSNKVWTQNNMWRKNARNGYGVDINRNYPHRWGDCRGSSGSTFADNYRGTAPASEPETQAMMNFVARIQPVMSISYHSYSELVLYPFGCDGEHTPSRAIIESTGRTMASLLPKDGSSGTYTPGTPWEILYAVDGGDIDWMYEEHGVLPFVIELNSTREGFQPSYTTWRNRTVAKTRAAWQFVLDRMESSGIRGFVRQETGEAVVNTTITVQSLNPGSAVDDKVYKSKPDGSFHIVLMPGMYRLRFQTASEVSEQDFVVGAERVDADIRL